MNTSVSPASFGMLKAESCVHGENTLAVVREQPFDVVAGHLEQNLFAANISIVHVHDFTPWLHRRGFPLAHRSRVYEVVDPALAVRLLALDPGLAHALPSRIGMHDHGGVVTVSTPMPSVVMAGFSHAAPVARLARTIEAELQRVLWSLP